MSYGLLKGCGCFYGACICSSPATIPASERLKKELKDIHVRFSKMEQENKTLLLKVEKFERLSESKYEAILNKAYKDSEKIIKQATKTGQDIVESAEKKAALFNELANGIRKAKTKKAFWEWFLKILPEVDEQEIVSIVKDELEHQYRIKI